MKRLLMLSLVFIALLSGCDYLSDRKYSGKVFDVEVVYRQGDKTRVVIWKNVNDLSYNSEENIYTFYVDGKLVQIDNCWVVILTQIGAPKPINPENKKYVGKKFDLSILHGKNIIKTWKDVEIKSADSRNVQFELNGIDMNIITSVNETIIIEEVTKNKKDPLGLLDEKLSPAKVKDWRDLIPK